jgi:hypothetical protein
LGAEPKKLGYLKYLVRRYIEFKQWDVGKGQMRYPVIYSAYRGVSSSLCKRPGFVFGFGDGVAGEGGSFPSPAPAMY